MNINFVNFAPCRQQYLGARLKQMVIDPPIQNLQFFYIFCFYAGILKLLRGIKPAGTMSI